MKKLLFIAFVFCVSSVDAASIDGTAAVQFKTTSYAFANGDFAKGFVRLDAGFSVPADATVTFNLLVPVAGVCDLNQSGKITLEGDLHLASNATIPNGCIIDGQSKTVFLDGNVSVPASTWIEFASNTVLDGQGHEIVFKNGNPGGELFINGPAGTKVTLRNMTIRGLRGFDNGEQAISFGESENQTLVLENVKLQLADDFFFLGGTLEIKNHVEINGFYQPASRPDLQPMLFYYLSTDDLLILADSTLLLDMTIGFIYQPFDTSNSHIVFKDYSSQLFLNGCAFFVPGDTGLKLTKGHIVVGHRAFLQSDGVVDGMVPIELGGRLRKASDDVIIDILPGAKLELADALVQYQNQK